MENNSKFFQPLANGETSENKATANSKTKNLFFAIEFSDIVFWLMKWKGVIITVTLVFSILGYLFGCATYSPTYTASASMVVNSKSSTILTDEQVINVSQIQTTRTLMPTYTEILTSDRVGTYIANKLDISLSAETIRGALSITAPDDVSVIYVKAKYRDAYTAKNIANAAMEIAPQLMADVMEIGSVNVLDYAQLPEKPEPSKTVSTVIIMFVAGFVLSSFFVILFNFITMKVKNTEDIETKTGINVFGEIPHASSRGDREKSFLFTNQANSGFAESYFMMGAVLRNNALGKKPYRLIFTSSVAGEGKTTNAINTTTVLADMGYRVLLIDLDMKKPNVARQLSVDIKHLGGTEAVIKGAPIEDNVYTTPYGFDIIPCSRPVRHTSKLLSSLRLEMFFRELDKTAYDYIIIDTAPAHIIADTSVIVKYADGLVMVIKQHFARLKIISDTIEGLKKSGANIIGAILNDVRVFNIGTGYAYKYKYGNGYGYYYAARYHGYSEAVSPVDRYIDSYAAEEIAEENREQRFRAEEAKQAERVSEKKSKNQSKLESIMKKNAPAEKTNSPATPEQKNKK